jgi:hypothetical protein
MEFRKELLICREHLGGFAATIARLEVRSRRDKGGADLISGVLHSVWLSHGEPNAVSDAIVYARHRSRSHDAAGNVVETHDHKVNFKEW